MSAKIFFRNFGHFISFPFVAISLLIGLSRSKGLYKKYYSDSDLLSEDERYKYVYKQTSKATFIANCKINYEGLDKIPKIPVMYVCNHKAGFDPLLMLKIFSQEADIIKPVFVSKVELLENKNVGNAAKLIDTIFIDRSNIRSAYKCIEEEKKVLSKRSVVVFIEGTRILSHQFGEFKSAALEPAFSTMRPIVPVVIQGSIGVEQEDKKSFFKYKEINVRFLPAIKPTEFVKTNREGLSNKLKKIMSETYNQLEKENPSRLYKPEFELNAGNNIEKQENIDSLNKIIQSKQEENTNNTNVDTPSSNKENVNKAKSNKTTSKLKKSANKKTASNKSTKSSNTKKVSKTNSVKTKKTSPKK